MTRMIDRLAEKGILHRVTNREDRRAWRIMLTEHGRRIYPDLLKSSERVLTRFFGSFTPAELDQLEGHLARIHAVEPEAGA
jgi:DNA-binding MarR family transcriptional regulator